METRKVQVTGGSTYTVSLPKTWATENDVTSGDTVELYADDETLLVTPRTDTDHQEGTLEVSTLEDAELVRAVFTMYVSGFDVIRLEASRLTTDQRRVIRSAIQGLVGVEVVEEGADHVVVQDLLDSAELSIVNAVTRMRLIATAMLEDAVTALVENDDDIARDVIDRDDDIDRLWLVVSRIFRATLRSPGATEELGVSQEDCFDYHSSARQLERIADHAVKISQLALKLDAIPADVADALGELHESTTDILETAMDALFVEDSDEATELSHDVLESVRGIDGHTRRIDDLLRELDSVQAQSLGLVLDSLSRSADYGGNVAETALQNATPSP
ncbi:phosphate uptake regulator PhoU [Natronobacterium gregoryi]|uniref:Phosphate uptake regulator n=2 Tax=Natronobacterium gregoryi TaxID=44930 RepID=L0AL74_NATGS|nr:phosphate uptake regulator PhoU [Natronobacterium gregoryi]AFZ73947.1 phosphate uptake regulator [Natronobacterium gregoryi SP2]ELY71718.1 phosphate uptake regulator PhoU [Natronobacterium gregoryi SP2]PLK19526.1 phosphate uptake regulator PhoU [Natronobacterium gregoryi SP2]SFJ47076.1 Phosphate uptake regulator [Natronobacterium gregoryi]